MRPSQRPIVIATRRSRLARAQSQLIARRLQTFNPDVSIEWLHLESEGDQIQERPLATAGGKGLFTRTIEEALLDKRADIAVHSLKDLPTEPTPGLVLAAIPPRANVQDALISATASSIDDLPQGARIGTSSMRRSTQMLRLRPDLKIESIRGNVDTRLKKVLEDKAYDATLLAVAGLERAGLAEHARNPIPVEQMLPAAAQAALAIQCRADDHVTLRRCLPLNDPIASTAVHAERKVIRLLGGDCHSPVAVLAELANGGSLRLRARVLSADGRTCLEVDTTGPVASVESLCRDAVKNLKNQGAEQVLREAAEHIMELEQ